MVVIDVPGSIGIELYRNAASNASKTDMINGKTDSLGGVRNLQSQPLKIFNRQVSVTQSQRQVNRTLAADFALKVESYYGPQIAQRVLGASISFQQASKSGAPLFARTVQYILKAADDLEKLEVNLPVFHPEHQKEFHQKVFDSASKSLDKGDFENNIKQTQGLGVDIAPVFTFIVGDELLQGEEDELEEDFQARVSTCLNNYFNQQLGERGADALKRTSLFFNQNLVGTEMVVMADNKLTPNTPILGANRQPGARNMTFVINIDTDNSNSNDSQDIVSTQLLSTQHIKSYIDNNDEMHVTDPEMSVRKFVIGVDYTVGEDPKEISPEDISITQLSYSHKLVPVNE